jgi:fucose permease
VLEVGAVITGSLIAAWTGEQLGLRATMWIAAGLIATGALICLLGSGTEPATSNVLSEVPYVEE